MPISFNFAVRLGCRIHFPSVYTFYYTAIILYGHITYATAATDPLGQHGCATGRLFIDQYLWHLEVITFSAVSDTKICTGSRAETK